MFTHLIQRLLMCLPEEQSHNLVISLFKTLSKLHLEKVFSIKNAHQTSKKLMGLDFKNPIGLAAGFDKNADACTFLANLGFGFIEVGTVTPLSQLGNTKPRLFRIKDIQCILNRMGFNNKGVDYLLENIKPLKTDALIGVSIGKNLTTPIENAVDDYLKLIHKLNNACDYFSINISSPNTKDLRQIQSKDSLKIFLDQLIKKRDSLSKKTPLVVKISPDVNQNQIEQISEILNQMDIQGIQLTNTTINSQLIETSQEYVKFKNQAGGFSGSALFDLSTQVLHRFHLLLREDIVRFGIGGIMNKEQACQKFENGADLVQIYTGFVYRGFGLVKELVQTNYSQ